MDIDTIDGCAFTIVLAVLTVMMMGVFLFGLTLIAAGALAILGIP
jgi:hypothetical protein